MDTENLNTKQVDNFLLAQRFINDHTPTCKDMTQIKNEFNFKNDNEVREFLQKNPGYVKKTLNKRFNNNTN